MKIYFKDAKAAKDVNELISIGFEGGGGNFAETFHDEEFRVIQCKRASRSFYELLLIAKTYFPETIEEELMLALKSNKCYAFYCPDVKHPVIYKNHTFRISDGYIYTKDDNNNKDAGGYSINSLLELSKSI